MGHQDMQAKPQCGCTIHPPSWWEGERQTTPGEDLGHLEGSLPAGERENRYNRLGNCSARPTEAKPPAGNSTPKTCPAVYTQEARERILIGIKTESNPTMYQKVGYIPLMDQKTALQTNCWFSQECVWLTWIGAKQNMRPAFICVKFKTSAEGSTAWEVKWEVSLGGVSDWEMASGIFCFLL